MEKILRNVVSIDESRCTGSGLCIDKCHDRALELRDGKVVLLSETLCCGTGGCLASCPEKALSLMRRVAFPYRGVRPATSARGAAGGAAGAIEPCPGEGPCGAAESGEETAASAAASPSAAVSAATEQPPSVAGSAAATVQGGCGAGTVVPGSAAPCLHWPLKLCVAPAEDAALKGAHILVAGDCTAFACAAFHDQVGRGRAVLIGCPKFENPKTLTDKMVEVFRRAEPGECSIARMEKPCCKGLVTICADAARIAGFDGPIRETVVYCNGALEEK